MKEGGQIVLFKFPRGDLSKGKLRPALLMSQLPGTYRIWLICMVSAKLQQQVKNFDEIIAETDDDFEKSGLKESSLIRLGRLAVVDGCMLEGSIGKIKQKRIKRLKTKLADWLMNKPMS
jgi:mRNA interferase MazF